jgi:hypothetical protein
MYVRGIYFGCVSDIFLLDFGTVLTVWYILAGGFFLLLSMQLKQTDDFISKWPSI